VLLAGCGGASKTAPNLRAGGGWHVGSQRAHAWAATVPYRDCSICVPPHRTLAALPPDGIVIQLTVLSDASTQARWPRIRPKDVAAGFEGVPKRYGVFQFGDQGRSAFVWFGRAHPTRRQLARANAELRTAGAP